VATVCKNAARLPSEMCEPLIAAGVMVPLARAIKDAVEARARARASAARRAGRRPNGRPGCRPGGGARRRSGCEPR